MQLPNEISPNPLVSATVEIRFDDPEEHESLLSLVYPVLVGDFPFFKDELTFDSISNIAIPDPDFAYEYTFKNDKYSISVGKNVIAFENLNGYHLWENYLNLMKKNILAIRSKIKINSIQRIGVRYISLFENENELNKILEHSSDFSIEGFLQQRAFVRTTYKKDEITAVVQIGQQVEIEKDNHRLKGLLIDIEAFKTTGPDHDNMDNESLFSIVTELHTVEKTLFFSLINKQYLTNNLNPVY